MNSYRYGHIKDVFVKKGDKVKKGQKIATVGTGNGQWSAHLHFDIRKGDFNKFTGYVMGWTMDEVKNYFIDPTPYIKTVFPEFDHYGWGWLDYATYSTGKCFHPGVDLNGPGVGNADIGDPIYSACDGEVVYLYDGPGKNGGWGKLLVIKESEPVKDNPKPETSKKDLQETKIPVSVNITTEPTKTPNSSISEATSDYDSTSTAVYTGSTQGNVPSTETMDVQNNDEKTTDIIVAINMIIKYVKDLFRSK